MKFKIQGSDLHYIMTVAGAACAKNQSRPILTAINCRIKDSFLTATALDGYIMHRITVPVEVIEDSGEAFNISPIKSVDTKSEYSIEVTDTEISYKTASRTLIEKLVEGTFIDADAVYPKTDPVFTISVDPKLLAKTLKAYGSASCIKFEFYGKASPFKFSTASGSSGIVLPVHNNKF